MTVDSVWVLIGPGSAVPVLVSGDLGACAAHTQKIHGDDVSWVIGLDYAVGTVTDPRAPEGTDWRAYRVRVSQ